MRNKQYFSLIFCILMAFCAKNLFAQCYCVYIRSNGKVVFKGTERECKQYINDKIKDCSRSTNTRAREILNSMGGGNNDLRRELIKGCEDNVKNTFDSKRLSDDCDGNKNSPNENKKQSEATEQETQSNSSDNINYDEMIEEFNEMVNMQQEHARAVYQRIANEPTFQRTEGKIIGELPPQTIGKPERPKPQKLQCDCGQSITNEQIKSLAEDYIESWLSGDKKDYLAFAESYYGSRCQWIYNKCTGRNDDFTLFCENLEDKILKYLPTLQKKYCTFIYEVDMPALCNNVYQSDFSAPEGWKRLKNYDFNYSSASGFFAALYQNMYDSTILVLAFRGSEDLRYNSNDWVTTNVLQGTTGVSEQYRQARLITEKVISHYKSPNKKLYLTGHSLGGGLASYAHISPKIHPSIEATYTYNSAALHFTNVDLSNLSVVSENIYAYHTLNDPLTLVQKAVQTVNFYIKFNTTYNFLKARSGYKGGGKRLKKGLLNIIGKEIRIPIETGHEIQAIEKYYRKDYPCKEIKELTQHINQQKCKSAKFE